MREYRQSNGQIRKSEFDPASMHPQHSRGNPSEPPGIHHGTITDLSSLQDPPPGQRPNYPYHKIARAAILGSPRKKMTLSELYEAVAERFEFFRTPEAGPWKVCLAIEALLPYAQDDLRLHTT